MDLEMPVVYRLKYDSCILDACFMCAVKEVFNRDSRLENVKPGTIDRGDGNDMRSMFCGDIMY